MEKEPFFFTNHMTVPMEYYLEQCDTFEQFEAKYLDQFLGDDNRVGYYLDKLLFAHEKDQATVSALAGLSRSYVGNIIHGRTRNPSRDVLIAICLAMEAKVEETQRLLQYAGYAPLYVRRKRDVIIWFGLKKKLGAVRVNVELEQHGFDILKT